MINNILVIDTETTGLPEQPDAQIIEVGALLFNIHYRTVTQTLSFFVPCLYNPVEKINNISAEWTQLPQGNKFIEALLSMVEVADCLVAHNAVFDRYFLMKDVNHKIFSNKQWVCTKNDFPWPRVLPRKRLEDVCRSFKIPYVNAHRALTDCQFLIDCFMQLGDLQQRFNYLALEFDKKDIDNISTRI